MLSRKTTSKACAERSKSKRFRRIGRAIFDTSSINRQVDRLTTVFCEQTSLMFGQNFGEAPHFVKGVIERRGRSTDYVWLAKIAFHTGRLQFAEQFFRMLARQDRQLTAPRCCISRRNYGQC